MRTIPCIGGLILGQIVGRLLVRTREGNEFETRGGQEARLEEEGWVLSSGECRGLPLGWVEDSQVHLVRTELEE